MDLLTRAWTIADRMNPRISAHVIGHVIAPVMDSACSTAWIRLTSYTSPGVDPTLYPMGVYSAASMHGLSRGPVDSRA